MNTVCSTSMTSAFNVVLNLACIWLLFVIMADVRKIRDSGKLSGGPWFSGLRPNLTLERMAA